MFDTGPSVLSRPKEPTSTRRSATRASPGAKRRKWGIYYTPRDVARLVAHWCVRSPEDVLLEPSFGGCALLAAAVEVFAELGCPDPSERMFGFDIDRQAFKSLATLGLRNVDERFRKLDFLASKPTPLANAVLANPPYVQYHKVPKSRRSLLLGMRDQIPGANLSGRASLWAYFVLHSMLFLSTGGRIAFILPRALETADYSESLLTYVRTKFRHVAIVHVDEQLFKSEGADEQVSLLLADGYQIDGDRTFSQETVATLGEFSETLDRRRSGMRVPTELPSIREQSDQLLSSIKSVQPLGDVATIRIGEVVGATKFFVRPLDHWRALGVSKRNLKPLLTRSSQWDGLALDESAIAGGDIPYLLLPPEHPNKTLKELLRTFPVKDRERNSTFGKRAVWYRCSYDTDFDAIIPSLNHQFARVLRRDAPISVGNGLYKIRTDARSLASWLPLIAFTTPFRLGVELHGRPRGGGALKLEPSDVRRLPVPLSLTPNSKAHKDAFRKCEDLLRRQDLPAATEIADELLYVQSGLLDRQALIDLRTALRSMVQQRLSKSA
jgi:adenine-specific DNA-methyltransferase